MRLLWKLLNGLLLNSVAKFGRRFSRDENSAGISFLRTVNLDYKWLNKMKPQPSILEVIAYDFSRSSLPVCLRATSHYLNALCVTDLNVLYFNVKF